MNSRYDPRRDKQDRLYGYTFFGGCACMIITLIYAATTKDVQRAWPVFVGIGWVVFLAMNIANFVTGEFRVKNGPTISRIKTPILFYALAIPFSVASMSIPTVMLYFYFRDK
jgi:hypothetical protein